MINNLGHRNGWITMHMLVTPMRQRGRKRGKHEVQSAVPVQGDLIVGQENSQELGRYTDVARFQTSGAADAQPLHLLLDVRLSHMGPLGFVLSGIEQIDGVSYAQSWYCKAP
ncbi:hypothetical protein [Paraburkholderia atlantica]|uniref:hypothetical protein n=2 Tax=Paraburkholderia TaxID=1822464 RepID=UPI0021A8A29A|nr:hypothetical protein [Paraburkholderia atlantica]